MSACHVHTSSNFVLGRLNAIVDYLKDQTGEGFGDFMTQLRAHPDVQGMGELANNKTPEEVALLVIGAHMTHSQFDRLCKQGGFRDPKYRSRYFLTEGFRAVEKSLPRIKIMKRPFPGCCFTPIDYLIDQLENDFGRLEFRPGPLHDFILVMRAGDGSNDAKKPMFNECYNLPQDSGCQSTNHCHLVALGRITESVESEKLHLGDYYESWDFPLGTQVKGKGIKQAYGGDGSDNVKKKGMGGFTAEYWCETCHADGSCKKKLSFLHPEVKDKVTSCREYEREACAVAGKCICTSYPCAKELIARVRKHAFDEYPSVTMENGRGKDDGGKWDPEHMQHPKHKEIGTWAQKNCYGQVRIYMCI